MVETIDQTVLDRGALEWERTQREVDALERQNRWAELGRQALGHVQRDRRDSGLGFVWEAGHNHAGLPAGFPRRAVDAATAAVAVEAEAAQALEVASTKARQWISTQRPSEGLARLKYEEFTLETTNALRAAHETTERAMVELGAEIEVWAQAHAVLSAAAGRRAVAERALAQALAKIDEDVRQAEQQVATIKNGAHRVASPLPRAPERWPSM